MRMPARPPSTNKLLNEQLVRSHDVFNAILVASADATTSRRYWHWDKIRHLKPPTGLTYEQWWVAMKLARLPLFKHAPLKDASGHPFVFALPDPIPEMLHHIDQDAAGRIEVAEQKIANPATRDRYIVRSLVEEAITSSQLEGAATTRRVAKEMIRSQRKPRGRDEQMILNNYQAMRRIRELKGQPLTPELLLELHRTLAHETMDDPSAVGRFRRPDDRVEVATPDNEVLHTPPPAQQLEKRLAALCDFANGATPDYFMHPVIRSIILHFWLAYEHPFVDGNGRCARALFYWSMLKEGYWLCEFISISQIIKKGPAKYGRAFLYTETDDNDLTYFILYHLDIIRRAIQELHDYIADKTAQVRQIEQLIRASVSLNHRQLALLGHALRHPDTQYTFESHRASHNVTYQTARSDLLDLVSKDLLTERKIGRRYCFSPVENLEDKLGKLR